MSLEDFQNHREYTLRRFLNLAPEGDYEESKKCDECFGKFYPKDCICGGRFHQQFESERDGLITCSYLCDDCGENFKEKV